MFFVLYLYLGWGGVSMERGMRGGSGGGSEYIIGGEGYVCMCVGVFVSV